MSKYWCWFHCIRYRGWGCVGRVCRKGCFNDIRGSMLIYEAASYSHSALAIHLHPWCKAPVIVRWLNKICNRYSKWAVFISCHTTVWLPRSSWLLSAVTSSHHYPTQTHTHALLCLTCSDGCRRIYSIWIWRRQNYNTWSYVVNKKATTDQNILYILDSSK